MTAFDDFFARAIQHEGRVFEDVPGDRGGPTKWGVTIGRLASSKGIREPKRDTSSFDALKAELFSLTEDEIKNIYRLDYWDAVRAEELPDGVRYAVADFGLNSGPSRAVKALQRLCGNAQTGRMDDETIRETHLFQPVELIMLYCDERARFLNAIVDGNASQRKFLKGWLARVGDVRRAAIKDAERSPVPVAPVAMPKADVAPAPGAIETAASSITVKAGGLGILAWIEEQFGVVRGLLPDLTSKTQEIADPLTSLGGLLRQNMSGIIAAATIGILAVMIIRHVRDKRELNALKGE